MGEKPLQPASENIVGDTEAAQQQIDLINSLRTRTADGGYLSNLVANLRNRYLSSPESFALNIEVRTLVEGFLTEIATIKAAQETQVTKSPDASFKEGVVDEGKVLVDWSDLSLVLDYTQGWRQQKPEVERARLNLKSAANAVNNEGAEPALTQLEVSVPRSDGRTDV